MDAIQELLTRGISEIIVRKELEELLRAKKKIKLYLGIDPTSTLLHLGNAIPLRKLREFQNLGHHVKLLIGNFTALIGDTSDKDAMRKPLTHEEIDRNHKTWKDQASKILDFQKTEIVYNSDWLSKLRFEDILNLANKFTVQRMIERDMYQERLKKSKPIGLHEFLYPLMQGYDSVMLNVDLEIGGNDQLFNMLAGRTLQKALKNREKHVITMKLLEGTDGRKMSKSYDNTINITDPPEQKFGKIMSTADELIVKYFELCTDVPLKEIQDIERAMKAGENPKDFKMRLGREVVKLYDGAGAAEKAEANFVRVFQKKEAPEEIPVKKIARKEWRIADLLVELKLAPSKSEARRLIAHGGIKIKNVRMENPDHTILLTADPVLIQVGKRRFVKVSTI